MVPSSRPNIRFRFTAHVGTKSADYSLAAVQFQWPGFSLPDSNSGVRGGSHGDWSSPERHLSPVAGFDEGGGGLVAAAELVRDCGTHIIYLWQIYGALCRLVLPDGTYLRTMGV